MKKITNKEYGQVLSLELLQMKCNIDVLENHLLNVIEEPGYRQYEDEFALGILSRTTKRNLTNINEILMNIKSHIDQYGNGEF